MNIDPTLLVTALGRTTLWLAAAGLTTAVALWLARPNRPTAQRLGCVLTLLVGWTFLRLPIAVPWYEASPAVAERPLTIDLVPIEPPSADATLSVEFAEVPAEPVPAMSNDGSPEPLGLVLQAGGEAPALDATAPPASAPHALATPSSGKLPRAIAGLWLLGMGALVGAWLVGYLGFIRALRSRAPADETWQAEWRDVLAGAGVRQTIRLSTCGQFGPVLCRLPRGYELVVPEPLWRELDTAARLAILKHELAHFRRGDVWKSLAARLLALPHWFNPLAWWAVRRFDDAAEWACDRAAVGDEPAISYARALLRLGEQPETFGYGAAARGRTLAARVRRVLAGPSQEDSAMKKACLIAIATVLVGISVVQLDLVAKPPSANAPGDDDPQPVGQVAGPASDAAPAAKMVEQAAKAYDAYQAAFEAETVTMPVVYDWSRRWMEAAESAATDRAKKIAAVRQHLERMRSLQAKIKLLYDAGTRGGEAAQMAAANYYVAEAERRLAQAEAAASGGERAVGQQQILAETQLIDLKIKIAELQGQLAEAAVALEAVQVARQAKSISRSEQQRLEAEYGKQQAVLASLKEQLHLYNEKLKLAAAAAQPERPRRSAPTQASPEKSTTLPTVKWAPFEPEVPVQKITKSESQVKMHVDTDLNLRFDTAIPKLQIANPELLAVMPLDSGQLRLHAKQYGVTTLNVWDEQNHALVVRVFISAHRYEGKTFSEWAEELQTDLSPTRRGEAIRALAAFGANGEGKRAAATIIEAARRHSIFSTEGYDEGRAALNQPATDAFHKIPAADSWPQLLAALNSDDAGRRLAAVNLLGSVPGKQDECVKLMAEALPDPDVQVGRTAINYLVQIAPGTPALVAPIRAALESDDPSTTSYSHGWIRMLVGRVQGDKPLESPAAKILQALGPVAIPAIEEALKPNQGLSLQWQETNELLQRHAHQIMDAIRAQPAEPKPEPKAAPDAESAVRWAFEWLVAAREIPSIPPAAPR